METEFITVVPAAGFTVLSDVTFKPVPKDGMRVRASAYWDRLLKEGAVTIKESAKPAEKPADKPVVEPVKEVAK